MSKALKKYISSDPGILGGTPVIKGTRIPVHRISFLIKQGFGPNEIALEYPQVSSSSIQNLVSHLMTAGLHVFTQNR